MVERISDPQNTAIKLQEEDCPVKGSLVRAILGKISDGILWIDLEGIIRIASPAMEKLIGSKGPLAGCRFWDALPDDWFGFSMKESLRYGISHERIYKNNLEISTLFLYQGEKREQGLLIRVADLTEKEKAAKREMQKDRMQELGEMVARLAHEIRNPLGGIRGFAMLLVNDLANLPNLQGLQELAHQIVDGTKSLERLVCSVLEYARPVQLQLQSHDMTAFLRNFNRFVKMDPAFGQKVRFHLHIPDEPMLIPFDPEALKRALLNLVINALQATYRGGEITLSLLQNGQNCQITLTDTGIGMDEETLASLFVPFFTTKSNGNGLGLVETKHIVTAHGGALQVHSSLNKGSSFCLTLPMRRP